MNETEMGEMSVLEARTVVAKMMVYAHERGWITIMGGNCSVRVGDVIYTTPSQVRKDTLTADDIVMMDLDGKQIGTHPKGYKPTSEALIHAAIYRARSDIGCIYHTHEEHAILISNIRWLRNFNPRATPEGILDFGRVVPIAPFREMWSTALATQLSALFSNPGVYAVLARNHGPFVIGSSPAVAQEMMEQLISQCSMEWERFKADRFGFFLTRITGKILQRILEKRDDFLKAFR